MKLRLLITGGGGFIGRNLIENLSNKYLIFSPNHNELELTNEQQVISYFKSHKIDVLIHCANISEREKTVGISNTTEINLKIFFNLLKCKKYYKKMIFFSSGAEYDKRYNLVKVKENDFGKNIPVDSYGFYKYVCSKFIEKENNIVSLRPFGIYGKYEDFETRFISYAICRTILNKPINIKKNVVFDYLYINDLIKIVEYFIENKVKYKFYNVGRGISVDLKTITHLITRLFSKNLPVNIINNGLSNEYTCDVSRLRKTIKKLEYTDFSESIKEMFNYYRSILPKLKHIPDLNK